LELAVPTGRSISWKVLQRIAGFAARQICILEQDQRRYEKDFRRCLEGLARASALSVSLGIATLA
jgi:hypothetical protein